MNFILTFLFFSIVHTAVLGVQYKCHSCHDRDAEDCKGEEMLCPEGSSCMTVSEEVNILGNKFRSVFKRCALNLPCNTLSRAYSAADTYLLHYAECCTGDLCNSGGYNMPFDNTEHLGPQCASCFGMNTTSGCTADRTTICPGAEDKCADLRGTILLPDGVKNEFSVLGCLSPAFTHTDYTDLAGVLFLSYNVKSYEFQASQV